MAQGHQGGEGNAIMERETVELALAVLKAGDDIVLELYGGVTPREQDGYRARLLFDKALEVVADFVFSEAFPESDGYHFQQDKTSAMADWLQKGDLRDATLENLVADWREYDLEEESDDEQV